MEVVTVCTERKLLEEVGDATFDAEADPADSLAL